MQGVEAGAERIEAGIHSRLISVKAHIDAIPLIIEALLGPDALGVETIIHAMPQGINLLREMVEAVIVPSGLCLHS